MKLADSTSGSSTPSRTRRLSQTIGYIVKVDSNSDADAKRVCWTTPLIRPLKRSTMPLVWGCRGGDRTMTDAQLSATLIEYMLTRGELAARGEAVGGLRALSVSIEQSGRHDGDVDPRRPRHHHRQ